MNSFKTAERQISDTFLNAVFIILSGGFQDAYTYFSRGKVFANAQTGNIVLMAAALFDNDMQKFLGYLIPVLSFIAGIFIAEAIHARFKYSEKIHWRQGVLLIEIILLFAVGFLPTTLNRLANALVSFVCAFQVQTFHKVRGHAYASTMCIGNMRSGTEALHAYFHTHDKGALRKSLTYFSVIIIFFLGAALGSVFTKQLETKAVFFCCALLLISFLMMFSKKSKKAQLKQ